MTEQAKAWQRDYESIFEDVIIPKYPEADKLLQWLRTTDFFTAPAARAYHSAFEGGLCYHSLLNYDSFYDLVEAFHIELDKDIGDAEIAIMTLCHDLCKIYLYKPVLKPVKKVDELGKEYWDKVPGYDYDEQFLFGHGEKSVYILMKFINTLPDKVYQAIRYHMGGMETQMIDKNSSSVLANNKYALILHLADMYATFGREERGDIK